MLRALYEGLDFTSPRDVAVFAAACVAFWGQCRLGEILPVSANPSILAYKPTRAHILRSRRKRRSTTVCPPRTKPRNLGKMLFSSLRRRVTRGQRGTVSGSEVLQNSYSQEYLQTS
ncbi:hypothetical protein B0H14DRAFT_2998932, partial [Mycena olivaceomarginata]